MSPRRVCRASGRPGGSGRSRRQGRGRPARDGGSAIAEFVMVSSLVLALGVGVFQLGLLLHVRNTLIACAAEGARAGARADATTSDAVARTRSLITQSLAPEYASAVSASQARTAEGIQVVEVTVTAPTPVIGLIGPSGTVTVRGRAFAEAQVSAR
ncbi:MAG: TadE family protein [Dermatophilaceae bacterium]